MTSSFSSHSDKFRKDKELLNPNLKLQTNIPVSIINVKKIMATRQENEQDGTEYAIIKMRVEVEMEGDLREKIWDISSGSLVDALEEKGIDVGSSFTVCKTGEGFKTKYQITNVKNKEVDSSVPAE